MTKTVDVGGEEIEVDGWEALDDPAGNAEKSLARKFQQELDHATMYRQCFSSTAGKYVLADLRNMFQDVRIIDGTEPPGSLIPGIRQGSWDVVARIKYMIEFANTGGGKPTGFGVPNEE